jgi:hypothetical protein
MIRALWSWANDAIWPLAGVSVALGLAIAWALMPTEAESKAAAQSRTRAAEVWVLENGLDAKITCYKHYCQCDVVPRDARPPFRLHCCGFCSLASQ